MSWMLGILGSVGSFCIGQRVGSDHFSSLLEKPAPSWRQDSKLSQLPCALQAPPTQCPTRLTCGMVGVQS